MATVAAAHDTIAFGTVRAAGTGADLLAILKLDGVNYRLVPTPIGLVGDGGNDTALSGQNGEMVDGIYVTSISIGRRHLRRYRATNLVERSCAINTLTHEISHIVSSHPRFANAVFEDTAPGLPPIGGATPIASYLIGSVAQCTYLQTAGRIAQRDVQACVSAFGKSAFNSLRCNQFAPTDPVEWPKSAPQP